MKHDGKNCLYPARVRSDSQFFLVKPTFTPCGVCEQGYYTNYMGYCEKLLDGQKLANCLNYQYIDGVNSVTGNLELNLVCAICDQNTFLDVSGADPSFTCSTLGANRIANCLIHQSNNIVEATQPLECRKCAKGYMLDSTLYRCIKINEVKNCRSYTTERCERCTSTNAFQNFAYAPNNADSLLYRVDTQQNFSYNFPSQIFNTANYQCVFDFNLDATGNFALPGSPIPPQPTVAPTPPANSQTLNCYFYDGRGNCIYCLSGFRLDSTGLVCSRIIDQCDNYVNQYQCEDCKKGFRLNTTIGAQY